MDQQMIEKIMTFGALYGARILGAVIIFIIGKWAVHLAVSLIENLMSRAHAEKTLTSFVRNIAKFGLMAMVVIAALNTLGVQTASLVAVIGAAGLAVGLALQGSLSNFSAGVILIVLKPFKVGDFISAGGAMGTVEEIQIFNTILNSPDNRRQFVPNAKITGDSIVNFSAIERRRIDLVFSISYKDDMKKAKEVLLQVVNADSRVLKDPAPLVAVSELGDSGINLVCRPWVKPADYWAVYFDAVEKGKLALEKAGCTIPFPQRDIHLYQEKA
ncbi:MAG: mechanosensitive ion channel [Candidatus Omnitrophica bacterium]|nr:mechanosensitive ion channel [Candidatus Omnitrophota bacterium]